jgi:hypothetical protein
MRTSAGKVSRIDLSRVKTNPIPGPHFIDYGFNQNRRRFANGLQNGACFFNLLLPAHRSSGKRELPHPIHAYPQAGN